MSACAWGLLDNYLYCSSTTGNAVSYNTFQGGGTTTYCSSGLSIPQGVLFLQGGQLLVANSGSPYNVVAIPPGGGAATVWANITGGGSALSPTFMAVSTDGRVFISLRGNNAIHYISIATAPGSTTPLIWTGVQGTDYTGIIFDSSNALYIGQKGEKEGGRREKMRAV